MPKTGVLRVPVNKPGRRLVTAGRLTDGDLFLVNKTIKKTGREKNPSISPTKRAKDEEHNSVNPRPEWGRENSKRGRRPQFSWKTWPREKGHDTAQGRLWVRAN